MQIYIIEDHREGMSKPFRIAETYNTIDGTRTRLTHHCFSTMKEAQHFIKSNTFTSKQRQGYRNNLAGAIRLSEDGAYAVLDLATARAILDILDGVK